MDIQEVRDSIDNAELIEHIMQCDDNGYYLLELFIQWRRIIFFSAMSLRNVMVLLNRLGDLKK